MTAIEVPITNVVPPVINSGYPNLIQWSDHFEVERQGVAHALGDVDTVRDAIFDLQQHMESVVYQIADHDGDVNHLWSQIEDDLDELTTCKRELRDGLEVVYEALREYEASVKDADEDVASEHEVALKDSRGMADNAEEVLLETDRTIDTYTRVFNF